MRVERDIDSKAAIAKLKEFLEEKGALEAYQAISDQDGCDTIESYLAEIDPKDYIIGVVSFSPGPIDWNEIFSEWDAICMDCDYFELFGD